MISDLEFERWAGMPNRQRVVLAELAHSAGVEYVASRPFISKPTDAHPNRPYNDLLQGELEIDQRIDSKLDLGVLDLVDDGSITHWQAYKWRGYAVTLRLGCPTWGLDDFRVIATQTNGGILEAGRGKIQLGIYDAAARLQREIARPVFPDGQQVPLILGQVFNAPATRISASSLLYRVSWLPVTALIVKDGNGPVITHTGDYSNGGFTAAAYSPRTLMCEVFEPNNTPLKIAQWVASHYGLTLEITAPLPTYTLGFRYDGSATGAQILDDLCLAIGGHWHIDALGKLRVDVFKEAAGLPEYIFYADDIEFSRIELTRTEEPLAQLTVNYQRNYMTIREVAGSINALDAQRLRAEWLAVAGDNSLTDYPLAIDSKLDTGLQIKSQAETERDRRLSIKSKRRDIFTVTILRAGLSDIVGKTVRIEHPRTDGRLGRIISAKYSPLRDKVESEIWY